MSYYSGQGQEEEICKTLKEPFTVKVAEGESPKAGIGIIWNIAYKPEGTSGGSVSPSGGATNTDGLTETYLTLGDYAGTYKVDAICSECDNGSPVNFTANAVCPPVPQYYQGDYLNESYDDWCYIIEKVVKDGETIEKQKKATCHDDDGNLRPGYTQFTIKEKGCALTSLSMVLERYESSNLMYSPPFLNATLTYSHFFEFKGFTGSGDVRWDAAPYINPQINQAFSEKSLDENLPLQNSLMDNYLKKCMPVIVKVKNWKKKADGTLIWNYHWVVVTEKSGNGYSINDPGYRDRINLSAYSNNIYAIQVYSKGSGGCQ